MNLSLITGCFFWLSLLLLSLLLRGASSDYYYYCYYYYYGVLLLIIIIIIIIITGRFFWITLSFLAAHYEYTHTTPPPLWQPLVHFSPQEFPFSDASWIKCKKFNVTTLGLFLAYCKWGLSDNHSKSWFDLFPAGCQSWYLARPVRPVVV